MLFLCFLNLEFTAQTAIGLVIFSRLTQNLKFLTSLVVDFLLSFHDSIQSEWNRVVNEVVKCCAHDDQSKVHGQIDL